MVRKTLIGALRSLLVLAVAAAPLSVAADPIAWPSLDDVGRVLVRSELGMRDAVRAAGDQITAWSAKLPAPVPDLSVLTCDPIPDGESSGFGWRDDPIRHDNRFHSGTDFRADPGTPVLAAGDGVVTFTGRQGGYGNIIYVDHGGGVVTRYAHLRKIETTKGAAVSAGDQIGQVGSTGRVTGPHLHFEVRLDGRAVDPVMALTVAELERTTAGAGRLASFALVPELQTHARDQHDHERRVRASRPERAGRAKRPQVLW